MEYINGEDMDKKVCSVYDCSSRAKCEYDFDDTYIYNDEVTKEIIALSIDVLGNNNCLTDFHK